MTSDLSGTQLAHASVILSAADFASAFKVWKEEIRSALRPKERCALIGIKRRGSALARRLWETFKSAMPQLEFGELDISLYRDDYHLQLSQPKVLGTEINFNVEGCRILLVDDVLYTGRTVRAAIDQISDFGRPKCIQLAVFIDRGHRELPIAPDFIGRKITTSFEDRVQVLLEEMDGEDKVLLLKAGAGAKGHP
ncbi:MAG: bifunctional pyr operon transcriptional regulator/uracil phosphoribosyltransferase PyrR [Planctomycetes bacterium]|nr:bifunctional pyr operon transcriptional regulator/uracil phosphoribosyltransferase PyrR [Planctomycetota bacterium]